MRKIIILLALLLLTVPAAAQDDIPAAEIVNDEGGVEIVTGSYFPTIPTVRDIGSQPIVFLGDISLVFDKEQFDFSTEYLNLDSPQVLASAEGNVLFEPIEYVVPLPIDPGGALTDIDGDTEDNPGIGVYTVNFTFNAIGSPFIDEREFIAFSSITSSRDFETLYEIDGGRMLVYAPEDGQATSAGFGDDGLLFTEDDPLVTVPAGYTLVDMSSDPFTFDRSQTVEMNILESQGSEFTDFGDLSYVEAFDAMLDLMRREYSFTELKDIDWDALNEAYRPRFEAATEDNDQDAYITAMRDFLWEIPDGHIGSNAIGRLFGEAQPTIAGGLGMAIRELDEGTYITNFILEDGPADQAGIELGAEITQVDGRGIDELAEDAVVWSAPFSTDHNRELQALRYAIRFPVGTDVAVSFQNPGDDAPIEVTLTTVDENESLSFSSFVAGQTGFELPIEFDLLPEGYGYISINSFSDDNLLTLTLWERAMREFNEAGVQGIVLDMRTNFGGSPDISNVMLGYFFEEPTLVQRTADYFPDLDAFEINPELDNTIQPAENFRFNGELVVLVSPACASACEFFTYQLTVGERVTVVGHYPSAGLGGGVNDFGMPDGIVVRFTVNQGLTPDGEIALEGIGVVPDVDVPVTAETLLSDGDPLLEAGIMALDEALGR